MSLLKDLLIEWMNEWEVVRVWDCVGFGLESYFLEFGVRNEYGYSLVLEVGECFVVVGY